MISRWQLLLTFTFKRLWFRATLFAIAAVTTALASILFKSFIPPALSVRVGAEAVDHILNILASSMLAVTTFSLSTMVTAYGSATTNVTPRATRLVVEDATTQNVLATFIGSFLFSLVGIIALSMGAYGEQGRVILFAVTLIVIALILITLLRWIQHLTSLGRVAETTARVEQATHQALILRARYPFLGGVRWLHADQQPPATRALYSDHVGYIAHVDIESLNSALPEPEHQVYLIAQPGHFTHPSRPVMYISKDIDEQVHAQLLEALSIEDARTFNQDPRFGLSVLAEIACRALSPAVNDPGTAIDVTGRCVRVLSAYAQQRQEKAEVRYPRIHVAPISDEDLFNDAFSPIARDAAGVKEVLIRLLKSLAMLAQSWPDYYAQPAYRQAQDVMAFAATQNLIASDAARIRETYQQTFSEAAPAMPD